MGKIFDWIDRRFNLKVVHKRFLKRSLPEKITYFHCLGGAAFTSYLCLIVTGLLLSIYYVPSELEAYDSIVKIQHEVRFGKVIRSVHNWSATLFIVFIILHTLRVFIHKAYAPPRQLNWLVGTLAMLLAFASGFTGYLLPWDQKAFWATEVGTSMASTIPAIGKYIMYFIRGGLDVTGVTLIRFYSMHVLWIPFFMMMALWVHFHMVRRLGIKRNL